MMLHFDPVTKEIWGEGSGSESDPHMDTEEDRPHEDTPGRSVPILQFPPMEDLGDDEINAADRLTRMVSLVLPFGAPGML
jgi:hypothetical protein